MLAPVVTICLTNRSGSHGPHKHPESQAWLTCQCQGLSTRGPRRTPQGHRPLPSALDVWLAGACNRPRPIRLFRCHSSTIAPLTATRTLDRMVLRQWAAAQKLAPGLRSGMSVCRLMAEESADAMAAASGLHESAQSTLAIVSRRPVPESAIGARAWCPGSTTGPGTVRASFLLPTSLRQFPGLAGLTGVYERLRGSNRTRLTFAFPLRMIRDA